MEVSYSAGGNFRDRLDRLGELVVRPVILAAAFCDANMAPVGGLVTGALETGRVNKGFEQTDLLIEKSRQSSGKNRTLAAKTLEARCRTMTQGRIRKRTLFTTLCRLASRSL
jgi:hypothetical protein